jgi:DNA-binding beta-propeller fold protein YncE
LDRLVIVDEVDHGAIAQLITICGSLGKGPEQLNEPEDIAVDNKGQIYVTDTRNSRIQILEIMN